MKMEEMLQQLAMRKLVPVIKLDRVEDAKPLGEALCQGGLPVAEVTFRTEAAEASIRTMREAFPEMLVGAGTVVNLEQAKRAVDAGAAFLVAPGTSEDLLSFAKEQQIPIFPGACTPTEIMTCLAYDLPVVKFFPAAQFGGIATIKALSGPFPSLRFMPTGGIDASNIREYLAVPQIIACGGSWMAKANLIREGKFAEITKLTAETVQHIQGV